MTPAYRRARTVAGALAVLLASRAAPAAAAPAQPAPRGRTAPRPTLRDVVVDSPCPGPACLATLRDPADPAALGRRVVYLSFDGAHLAPSSRDDDAREGVSAILEREMTIPPFDPADLVDDEGLTRSQIIARIVEDTRRIYAPYDVDLVTHRPSGGHYQMVLFGSDCGAVAGRTDCAGIALRDCNDRMPDNIAFAFPLGLRVEDVGVTAAHEIGHTLGLAHTADLHDVMYYKVQTSLVPDHFGAGDVTDPSSCGGDYQDSDALLVATVGARAPDQLPPAVIIASPGDGAAVTGGAIVDVDASDDVAVARVELWLDGSLHHGDDEPPYQFVLPTILGDGSHLIEARAWDMSGNPGGVSIAVTVGGTPAPKPNAGGVAGDVCRSSADCASGVCGTQAGETMCTERCDEGEAAGCAAGFECAPGGVCWPQAPDEIEPETPAGCAMGGTIGGSGGLAWLPFGAWLLVARWLILRTRRRTRAPGRPDNR